MRTTFSYTGTAFAQGNWGDGMRGIGALYQEGFNMAWYGTEASAQVVGGMAWEFAKTPYRIVTETGPNTVNAWGQWQAGQVSGWEVLFHGNNLAGDVTAVAGTAYGVGKYALTRGMRGNSLGTFGMPDEMMPPRAAGGNVFEPPQLKAGTGTLKFFELEEGPHLSIAVKYGDQVLETEQTNIIKRWTYIEEASGLPEPVAAKSFYMPDAKAAQSKQQELMNAGNLGPYSVRTNSCMSHVCDILSTGGVDVPSKGGDRLRWLESLTPD